MRTPPRQVRIPDEIWARAQTRARAEGRSLSQVMRDAVVAYAAVVDPDDHGHDWYAEVGRSR